MTFLLIFIRNIAIYADGATLYAKCEQASDLWQQLELASERESDLGDTIDRCRKWPVDFSTRKTRVVSFHCAIDVNMDRLSSEKIIFEDAGSIFPF